MRVLLASLLILAAEAGAQPLPYTKTEVRSFGLVGKLYRPPSKRPLPAVLLIGGSGGGIGWQEEMGDLLARQGYASFALGYFGMPGLSEELERIPIEYFQHAADFLRLQPFVDARRVAVVAVSKGSEAALLLASMTPEITALALFAPSAHVWQSVAKGWPETSSWSYQGRELPFVRYGKVPDAKSTADLYLAGMAQADAVLERAAIRVEKINGPILMMSGLADNLWPSAGFAERIAARLRANGFAHQFEHVSYPDAGHLISSIRKDDVSRRGGTDEGNRKAQVDARKRMLAFLDAWRKAPAPKP